MLFRSIEAHVCICFVALKVYKELERTIGMWREHLGLSYKVNPQRMKESPKETVDESDPMLQYYKGKNK